MWRGFHTIWGAHNLRVTCTIGYAWIPQPCLLKSVEKSQERSFILKDYSVSIDKSYNKYFKKVGFKTHHSGKGNDSGGGSYSGSDLNCFNCGNKVHIKRI